MEKERVFQADRLVYLRNKKGLSQTELAKLTGMGRQQISKYERGEIEPSALALVNLAKVLDCSVDFLLGIEERERQAQKILTIEQLELLDMFESAQFRKLIDMLAKQAKNL